MGDSNRQFKIIFNDGSSIMKIGTDYTSTTVTTREYISAIFNNKENLVTTIEINAGCDIPFYTNNPNFTSETTTFVDTYLKTTGLLFSNLPNLTSIKVAANNPYFSSINGVLFSLDNTILYTYPSGKGESEYTVPSSVTKINGLSFMNTPNLRSVIVENTTINNISFAAFANATGLTTIKIPNNVTIISSYSFYKCNTLTTFTSSTNVTIIGSYAFSECSKLISVTIPNNQNNEPVTFNEGCFRKCSSLKTITLPNTTKFHDKGYIFSECSSLTVITIPNSVLFIPIYTFYSCVSLTSVTLPNALTEIRSSAFLFCKSLPSISLPNTLLSIQNYGFSLCISLTAIRIPASVTDLGDAFVGSCTNLTSCVFENGIKIKKLGVSSFFRCIKLGFVTIPLGVAIIGSNCFAGTQSLTGITFPESITDVSLNAFSRANLINMDNTPPTIIEGQFYNSGLKTLYLSSRSLLTTLKLSEGNDSTLYGASNVNVVVLTSTKDPTVTSAPPVSAASPTYTPLPLANPPPPATSTNTSYVPPPALIRFIIAVCMLLLLLVIFSLMSSSSSFTFPSFKLPSFLSSSSSTSPPASS